MSYRTARHFKMFMTIPYTSPLTQEIPVETDTKCFRNELDDNEKRRFLLKKIDSFVDQTNET